MIGKTLFRHNKFDDTGMIPGMIYLLLGKVEKRLQCSLWSSCKHEY